MGGVTDPVADFLTQIRNASHALKENVTIARASQLTIKISEILKREGFIENFKVMEDGPKKAIRIHLKYRKDKRPAIEALVRVSKPGLRHYVRSDRVPQVLGGFGISILSTSKGILTNREARHEQVGGELICKIW